VASLVLRQRSTVRRAGRSRAPQTAQVPYPHR
jgi:hypothetical protein